jgi:hypothetical protein
VKWSVLSIRSPGLKREVVRPARHVSHEIRLGNDEADATDGIEDIVK